MTSLGVLFRCPGTWNFRSRNLNCTADDTSHTKYIQYFLGVYALKASYNEYTASNAIFREDEWKRGRHVKGRDCLHIFGVQKIRKTGRRKGFQTRIFYIDCNNAKINCDRYCKQKVNVNVNVVPVLRTLTRYLNKLKILQVLKITYHLRQAKLFSLTQHKIILVS